MYPTRDRRRRLSVRTLALLAVVGGALVATFAVSTDAFGAGHLFERAIDRLDRFIAGPVPDRPTDGTILVTAPPLTPAPTIAPTVAPTPGPSTEASSATPTPTPTPTPARVPVDVDIATDPDSVFAHELKDTWCAPAGVQMALAFLGLADTSDAFQNELQGRVREWESYGDSHNGKWGPSAMVLALEAYGASGYEVRGYETREDALRDAAVAIETTRSPVILLAWRGAHTWVMTGFRADADPQIFRDATVEGAYVLDPWYPWVSSIWGPSDPPGTFQDSAEMERNYLRWKRPEGNYPERDGLFISVVPTVPVSPAT
ncbi:MAG: hypothetical protein Q7S35_06925 [Candidatus Limnocylindrales bacterium]|nr:hypothetical protein [Candidatus Limnocylindrales bacterium]